MQRTAVDTDGRPTQQQIGDLTPTDFGYDPDHRLATMTRGSGPTARVSTLSYDGDGNVESVTDPAARTVSFTYDGTCPSRKLDPREISKESRLCWWPSRRS